MRFAAVSILLFAVYMLAGCEHNQPKFLLPAACPAAGGVYYTLDGVCNQTQLRDLAELRGAQTIAVFFPGGTAGPDSIGYYAHAFAEQVGAAGQVFDFAPGRPAAPTSVSTIGGRRVTGDYEDRNVTKTALKLDELPSLPRLDVIWAASDVSSFFADLQPVTPSLLRPLHDALRPGGLFFLMDADVDVVCIGHKKTCPRARPFLIAGLPRGKVKTMIEKAGFEFVYGTEAFENVNGHDPDRVITPWGSMLDIAYFGRPFLWKFRRLPP